MSTRALVTGGAGFIGSHLVDALVAGGASVVVLDDLSTGHRPDVNPRADLIVGDVADPRTVARVVDGCDVVYHQAAHRAVFRSVENPLETDRANVAGTLNVLVAARDAGVGRVIVASSSSVYGSATSLPTSESAEPRPLSPYAVSKLAGEHYARVFWELFGLETVALRYFNVFGPRQRVESRYATVVPLFIDALRAGRPPQVHGDGSQSRDFTFVSDAVAANLRAASAPAARCAGRVYNVAGGTSYTVLDLLSVLSELVGVDVEPSYSPGRPGDMRHTEADVTAAAADLGHVASVSFAEGLVRTVDWVSSGCAADSSG